MKSMIKRIITGVIIGLILFNIKSCNVHAYVYIGTINGDLPITRETPSIVSPTNIWPSNGVYMAGTDDWLYSAGQFWVGNNLNGNQLIVNADYYFGIETRPGVRLPSSYLNNARNTLTANNLRCGIGASFGSGYDSSFSPQVSNFNVTRAFDLSQGNYPHEVYHITFNYKQKLGTTISGSNNMSCWFSRVPSDGLFLQVFGNTVDNIFYGYTTNLSYTVSSDPNTTVLQTIEGQNQTIINQNNETNQRLQGIGENQVIINNNISDFKNTITDSTVPSNNHIANAIDSNKVNPPSNVADLINILPNTLQVIVNGFNSSCAGGYSLGSLLGTELIIPCINPVTYLGSYIWGVIDAILCLCFIIPFSKYLVNLYNDFTSLKNRRLM